jgi:hypothetical protein
VCRPADNRASLARARPLSPPLPSPTREPSRRVKKIYRRLLPSSRPPTGPLPVSLAVQSFCSLLLPLSVRSHLRIRPGDDASVTGFPPRDCDETILGTD